jgi:8-oxo-dGTP pyrophosphatase MutT (NUDIX family)
VARWELTEALRADDPRLAPCPQLALVRATLEDYRSPDPDQLAFRAQILAFLDAHPLDAHRRGCRPGHLTASALVVDARIERALLTHHKKLGRWLQLGGHCDGDANLAGAALREAREESGIEGLAVLPRPIDLDVHAIPARPGEPEHLHLDTRFLVIAAEGVRERVSEESHELRWFRPEEARRLEIDASLRRLVDVVFGY